MFLVVDISEFVNDLFQMLVGFLLTYFQFLDGIVILHRSGFSITFLDFTIGIIVVSIVLGAFLHINKPDDFYVDKR